MKKVCFMIIMLIILLLETSCNYRAIEDMPMIIGCAVDPNEEGFSLTAKVVVPSSGAQGGQSEEVFIRTSGETVFDAVRDFIMKEGQRVFWGQLEVVIINQDITKDDIVKALDFFTRDDEIREDISLIVSKKEYTAAQVLVASRSVEGNMFYITEAFQNADSVGKYPVVTLADFNNVYLSKGSEALLPLITIEERIGVKRILVNGGLIFRDNKSVGELNGREVQAYRMITDQKGIGILVVDYKDIKESSKISLDVGDCKSKVKFDKKGTDYLLNVEVALECGIGEVLNNQVNLMDTENMKKFKQQVEEQITLRLESLIKKLQTTYQSDIFAFGEKFKNQYPKTFKSMEDDWNLVFSALQVNVSVKLKITGSALTKQPFKEGK